MAWVEHTSGQHWRVRYRRADGTITSEGGFTTPTTAHTRAQAIGVDQHRGTFYDPTRGHTTVNEWLPRWWTTLTLDETTLENYHYLVTTHIKPRFGHIPLGELRASDVTTWSADLHTAGYQHSTIWCAHGPTQPTSRPTREPASPWSAPVRSPRRVD